MRAHRQVASSSTVPELWEAWFAVASGSWRRRRFPRRVSVIDRYLTVYLGTVRVGELSAFTIDEAYVRLRAGGGSQRQPLTVSRDAGPGACGVALGAGPSVGVELRQPGGACEQDQGPPDRASAADPAGGPELSSCLVSNFPRK